METVYLKNYKKPAYTIPTIDLYFNLFEEKTIVTAKTKVLKSAETILGTALELDGEKMQLLSIKINQLDVPKTQYQWTDEKLILLNPPSQFDLEITTELQPQDNKSFTGLYKTKKIFCTQMEAQGFRRVTYFLDRPDVLSKYTTTIEADSVRYPQLLSNGDKVASQQLNNGRHSTTWKDPFLKPCYLFALVAGDLGLVKDTYKTLSGRTVDLEIYTDKGNEARCHHAMDALKQSMKWDEDVYGLEYDLNVYMIVAVEDFNMGAMENKGLNIFNSKYVLSDEKTATDSEAMGVQSVIAHEYFHNWSGNRVTCRDWFQLSLKEGLTVFRDQEFSSDLNSRPVKRIEDVINLRTRQFPEDASGMAHPIRPDSYIAIDNFYTRTVYEKGAEVIRMLQTLVGREKFIQGVKNYFSKHDGQAVTTEDFIKSHEETSNIDLTLFKNWYTQAGTPTLTVRDHYDSDKKELTLWVEQKTVDPVSQKNNEPYHIPLKYAAYGSQGKRLNMKLMKGLESTPGVLELRESQNEFVFKNVTEKPVLSLLGDFSAPVRLLFEQNTDELCLLMANDENAFNRYESAQKLYTEHLLTAIQKNKHGETDYKNEKLFAAMKKCLENTETQDASFLAKLLTPPSVAYFMQFCPHEQPHIVEQAYRQFFKMVQVELAVQLQSTFALCKSQKAMSPARAMDLRALKAVVLNYLSWDDGARGLEFLQSEYSSATTMTETMNVLLSATHYENSKGLFEDFENKWSHDSLVMNKWFTAQALSWNQTCLETVKSLTKNPNFDKTNPNKIYALVSSFTSLNPLRFHESHGTGYDFACEQILDVDQRNPQVAARLATCFNEWASWAPELKKMAQQRILKIHQTPGLSKNVFEIMDRALKMS